MMKKLFITLMFFSAVFLEKVNANSNTQSPFETCFNSVEKERFELNTELYGDEEINKDFQDARREYGKELWHVSTQVIETFKRKDLDALVSLMSFPLLAGPREDRFEQESFDELFTPEMIEHVANAEPTCSSFVDKGGMIANGLIWIDTGVGENARSDKAKIFSIRATEEKFTFPPELTYSDLFDNKVIHPSCLFVYTPSDDEVESIIEHYELDVDPISYTDVELFSFVSEKTSKLFIPEWNLDNPNLSKWDQVALSMPLTHCLINKSEVEAEQGHFTGNSWTHTGSYIDVKEYDFLYMLTTTQCESLNNSNLGVDTCFIARVNTSYRYMSDQYFVYGLMSNNTIAPLKYVASNRDELITYLTRLK